MKRNYADKLTKIVATIGPATETEEVLAKLIKAGLNVARFNTKHGTPEWHHERIVRVRKVAEELGKSVAVLMDLQGPEIRTNTVEGKSFMVKEGESVFFTYQPEKMTQKNLVIIPQNVVEIIDLGRLILTDDGLCQFEAIKKGPNYVEAKALDNYEVKHRKTLSVPGLVTDMPVLIENDYAQLDGIKNDEVDYVALSFVRDKNDINTLRQELKKRKLTAAIIAKIENQSAADHLDEIIAAADGIMVARGDLGVEVPFEELVYWQKQMIDKCRLAAKPVITATHMLESMVETAMPTRAEISDVAHAIYDLTDAVMLSEETTIGKWPVKAVETQARIALFNEKFTQVPMIKPDANSSQPNLAYTASYMVNQLPTAVDAIVCLTETGETAAHISRNRPRVPVHVLTSNENIYHRLALNFGLIPHLINWQESVSLQNMGELAKKLSEFEWLKKGQRVLVLHGPVWRVAGETNTITLLTM